MQLFRVLSIGMLLSLPVVIAAGYERKVSLCLMQGSHTLHKIDAADIFNQNLSGEDQKLADLALGSGIVHGSQLVRNHIIVPMVPLFYSLTRNQYILECQDNIAFTERCAQLRAQMDLIRALPHVVDHLQNEVIKEVAKHKEGFPKGSHIGILIEYSTPEIEANNNQDGVITPTNLTDGAAPSEAGSSEAPAGDTGSSSSAEASSAE